MHTTLSIPDLIRCNLSILRLLQSELTLIKTQ